MKSIWWTRAAIAAVTTVIALFLLAEGRILFGLILLVLVGLRVSLLVRLRRRHQDLAARFPGRFGP